MKYRIQSFSAAQIIIGAYIVAIVLFTSILLMPISIKPGQGLSVMDALFVATSAVSITGLTPVNTVETFSMFGQCMLLLAFQFGGIGLMTLGTLLWLILGQNVSLSQRRLLMIDQNQNHLSGLVRLLLVIVKMVLIFEAGGTLIFGFYFKFSGYYEGWIEAFYHAMFHALSSFTNAGFDIFGNSMMGFADDYFVQIITMLLIISGSVGFPVLVELREYLFGKIPHFRFSLFTKITSITFFGLLVAGTIGFWLMERQLFMEGKSWHAQLFYSLFSSVTTRSGGMATLDMAELGGGTQFFTSILMFIGGSPSSAGGGIRTTTFAVIILTLISVARSRKEVMVFRRTLKHEDVLKSFFVFAIACILCVVSVLILDITEVQRFPLSAILFEVGSAFGTCGLSLGITSQLSDAGKPILIMLMFIGRIGLLTLLYMFRNEKQRPLKVRYPEEKIIIG
jgi:Trk-type K+ transport system membrane component